jgi:hypothetical protein
MNPSSSSEVDLSGIIDMHIHTAPDIRPRYCDDVQAAREAKEAGMRAILLKSHITLTADRAIVAQKVVGDIHVFGSLVLNAPVGGLNPEAVEVALKMGAKEIWMPTFSAANEVNQRGEEGGITIFTEGDKVHPNVHEIANLVHQADAILATGHISIEESLAMVHIAREHSLRKILITHPESSIIRMPIETQVELAGKDLYFERCYVETTPPTGSKVTIQEIAAGIRHVGVASTIITSDFGLASLPAPVQGMREYITKLLGEGIQLHEINQMASENPAYLLNL